MYVDVYMMCSPGVLNACIRRQKPISIFACSALSAECYYESEIDELIEVV